ncbi:hypothetical protein [Lentzea sp. NPDC060358]|uniref:hypothetical protein n=1 Tax=Lentzea sp. NPDC060358 TaxID=3347103 RepID=UPI0036597C0A
MVTGREDLNKGIADAALDVRAGLVATAASLAMGAGPVPATIIGASGPALKLTHRVLERARQRREDRAARTVEQAAEILDVGIEILEERASSYDDRLELLARVLEAAARTPVEKKITALAQVLAEGLRDGGSVDEALVIAAALTDVEAPHVFVLHHLAVQPLPPEDQWEQTGGVTPRGWNRAQLKKAVPEVSPILDGLLAVLEGHGLVRTQADSTYDGLLALTQYAITPLGRRCLFLFGEDLPSTDRSDDEADPR